MADETKPIGRLRKLYRTVACAMCGSDLEAEVPASAPDGTIVDIYCIECGGHTKVRLTGEALEEIGYQA